MGSEKKSFQGAMSVVDTLESGKLMRAGDKMKCLAYTLAAPGLQGVSEGEARSQLLTALLQIAQPVKCNFRKEVCRDCGQKGDRRLMTDYCHEEKIVEPCCTGFLKCMLPPCLQCPMPVCS